MSNFRLACTAFVLFFGLSSISEMFGVTGRYEGFLLLAAKAITGLNMAAIAVAFWGDRNHREPKP